MSVWCWQQLRHEHKPSFGAIGCLCLGCRAGRGNCGIKMMVTIVQAVLSCISLLMIPEKCARLVCSWVELLKLETLKKFYM